VLELKGQSAVVADHVSDDSVLVDGRSVSDVGGVVLVSVLLDKHTGGLLEEPLINTRGFAYESEAPAFAEAAPVEVRRAVEQRGSRSETAARVSRYLAKMALSTTGR